MSACESCWGEAYIRSLYTGKSQVDLYYEVMREREKDGAPCTKPLAKRRKP